MDNTWTRRSCAVHRAHAAPAHVAGRNFNLAEIETQTEIEMQAQARVATGGADGAVIAGEERRRRSGWGRRWRVGLSHVRSSHRRIRRRRTSQGRRRRRRRAAEDRAGAGEAAYLLLDGRGGPWRLAERPPPVAQRRRPRQAGRRSLHRPRPVLCASRRWSCSSAHGLRQDRRRRSRPCASSTPPSCSSSSPSGMTTGRSCRKTCGPRAARSVDAGQRERRRERQGRRRSWRPGRRRSRRRSRGYVDDETGSDLSAEGGLTADHPTGCGRWGAERA